MMSRLHLFEFNDSSWCPGFVRDSVVEVLGRVIAGGDIPESAAPVLARFISRAGIKRMLDLGSGTGLTTAAIVRAADDLGQDSMPEVILSDLMGGREAGGVAEICNGHCRFWPDPVNAMAVDPAIAHDGRSFFCVFHHFRPDEAIKVITAAVDSGKAVIIMEPFPRNPLYLRVLYLPSLFAYLLNPFRTRRHRLLKFVFTFLVPLLPFIGLWDGLVSTTRIYDEEQLRAMAVAAGPDYRWEFHRLSLGSFRELNFFMGFRGGGKDG